MKLDHLHENFLCMLAGIGALLVISSVIVWYLAKSNKEKDYSELIQRVKTWWIMVAVFSLAMILSRYISLVFFSFISFLALKEYFTLIPTRRADHRVLFLAYLAIPIQYLLIGCEWYGMFIIFIPIYMFLLIPVRMILIGDTDGFLKAAGIMHWGLMLTVFMISHVAFLLVTPAEQNPLGGGPALVLFLVFLTQFNDVMQYTFGKLYGKNKVIPKISPGKTWEGLIGGVFATTVSAMLIAPYITPLTLVESLGAGIIISLSGFFGDLSISALKRDLGVKDSGSLLPGHGGILDRIDSLTYAAPLFFHYVWYLHM